MGRQGCDGERACSQAPCWRQQQPVVTVTEGTDGSHKPKHSLFWPLWPHSQHPIPPDCSLTAIARFWVVMFLHELLFLYTMFDIKISRHIPKKKNVPADSGLSRGAAVNGGDPDVGTIR